MDIDAKDKQIKMLQQTLKGMQEQLMQSQKQQVQDDQKIKDLMNKLNSTKMDEPLENEVITLDKDDDVNEEPRVPRPMAAVSGCVQVTQKDAKLIGKSLQNISIIIVNHLIIISLEKILSSMSQQKVFQSCAIACDIKIFIRPNRLRKD